MTGRRAIAVPRLGAAALAAADVALAALALAIGYVLRFHLEVGALERVAVAPFEEYAKLFSIVAVALPVLLRLHELYRTDGLHTTLEETYAIAKVVTLATGLALALTFFYRDFTFSRLAIAYFWLLAIAFISLAHAAFRRWLVGRYRRGFDRRRAVVVGEPAGYLVEKLRTEPAFGVEVLGYVGAAAGESEAHVENENENEKADGKARRPGSDSGRAGVLTRSAVARGTAARPLAALARLGAIDEIGRVLDRERAEEAVILEHGLTHRELLETIESCEQRGIEVRLIPPVYDLLVEPRDLTFVEGVPILRIDEARFHRTRQVVKRAFDVAFSAGALALLAPLMIAIAVAIRRTSRGPALFVQVRAGRYGRPFRMLKFRTMVPDAEERLPCVVALDALAEPVFKLADDPRVTPLGRTLRRFSLDELPQLLNVLRGEMSIVGPRPEEVRIVEQYDIWQRRRLKVRPGITGLQQVVARGTLSNLNERVRLDIYYTRKQSFLLDLLILARTIAVVISGRGAT